MSTNDITGKESAGTTNEPTLPPAIGIDERGRVHHVAARFATVAIVATAQGEIIERVELDAMTERPEYVARVADAVGWTDCWAGDRLSPAAIGRRIAAARTER